MAEMKPYRFSPVKDETGLHEAIDYVIQNVAALSEALVGQKYPLGYVTVFAHYPDEYEALVALLPALGTPHDENNGPRILLNNPIVAEQGSITHLRIRKPDPYRMQVGCADLIVPDYDAFKKAQAHNPNIRLIVRPEYEMLELFHPDFDVLAYVVDKPA